MKIVRIKNKSVFLLIFIFIQLHSFSQERFIFKGKIVDTLGVPVSNANILVNNINGERVSFSKSDHSGSFHFDLKKQSTNYIFEISSLEHQHTSFILTPENQVAQKKEFKLKMRGEILSEVLISVKQKIRKKNDTIVYDATQYVKKNDNAVEDLIKRLPGIKIDSDGGISVNGKAISKILVEGNDLFSENYKIISKSLNPNAVNEIEILNNYNDNLILKQISRSDNVALNLKFKDSIKNQIVGDVKLGLGVPKKTNNKLDAMLLNSKTNFYTTNTFNNTGSRSNKLFNDTSFENNNINRLSEYRKKANYLIRDDDINLPKEIDETNINDNNSLLNALGASQNINEKLTINALVFYSDDKILKKSNKLTEFNAQSSLTIFENKSIKSKTNLKNVDLKLKNIISTNKLLNVDFRLYKEESNSNDKILGVNQNFHSNLKNEDVYFSQHMDYTVKITDNAAILFENNFTKNAKKQHYNLVNQIIENNSYSNLVQNYKNEFSLFEFGAYYISKKLNFQLGYSNFKESLISNFYKENVSQLDNNISNDESLKNIRLSAFGSYEHNFYNKVNLLVGLSCIYDKNQVINRDNNNLLYLMPKIKITFKTRLLGKTVLNYNYKNNYPNLKDLYGNYILIDNRSFFKGSDTYLRQREHSISLAHYYSNWKKQYHLNILFDINYKTNGVVTSLTTNSPYLFYNKNFGKSINRFLLKANWSKYIPKLKSSIGLSVYNLTRNYQTSLNSTTSDVRNSMFNIGFSYASLFKSKVNFKTGVNVETNNNKLKSIKNTSTTKRLKSYFDVEYDIGENYFVSLSSNQLYPYSNSNNKQVYNFINASLLFDIKNLKFNLSCQNLLNHKSIEEITIIDFQKTKENLFLINRFVLLEAKWNF
ncbi:TonB-dependent receptor [Mangrovimonas cancribranchiae]|uniref:Carboxypeptidase-like regulatory domain-containing protein n=1 Tax=Mangrovimonas cancribranchiae TaxID=3080055 RepID=A0AAU6P2E4_9FLAO